MTEIKNFLELHSRETVIKMARKITDEGLSIIDLIEKSPIEDGALLKVFLPILDADSHKPLSALIQFDDIAREYSPTDKTLEYHLQLGCQVLNETRMLVQDSTTHPSNNHLSIEEQEILFQRLLTMRKEHSELLSKGLIRQIANTAIKHKIGNCGELSCIARVSMYRMYRRKYIEL